MIGKHDEETLKRHKEIVESYVTEIFKILRSAEHLSSSTAEQGEIIIKSALTVVSITIKALADNCNLPKEFLNDITNQVITALKSSVGVK